MILGALVGGLGGFLTAQLQVGEMKAQALTKPRPLLPTPGVFFLGKYGITLSPRDYGKTVSDMTSNFASVSATTAILEQSAEMGLGDEVYQRIKQAPRIAQIEFYSLFIALNYLYVKKVLKIPEDVLDEMIQGVEDNLALWLQEKAVFNLVIASIPIYAQLLSSGEDGYTSAAHYAATTIVERYDSSPQFKHRRSKRVPELEIGRICRMIEGAMNGVVTTLSNSKVTFSQVGAGLANL